MKGMTMEFNPDDNAERLAGSIYGAAKQLAQIHASAREGAINRPGLKEKVTRLIQLVRSAIYPHIFGQDVCCANAQSVIGNYLNQAALALGELICAVDPAAGNADAVIAAFIDSLSEIAKTLETDIEAAYEGDPAALSKDEIMLAYPAFEAISIFRLAHRLYELKVPLLPRMMTEYAHSSRASTSTPAPRSGNISSSTTARASSSGKPAPSAATSSSIRASRSARRASTSTRRATPSRALSAIQTSATAW
jgi:serine O-acetyltransferase